VCLILLAYKTHPDYPFILGANRDEFLGRPTAPAGFWEDARNVLGGTGDMQPSPITGICPIPASASRWNGRYPLSL